QWGDTPWANIGIMQNQGIDGNIEFSNTTHGGFYYSFRGNMSFARNKIIEDDTVYHTWDYQDTRGRSAGLIYGLTALGLFEDQADVDNSPKQELGSYGVGDIKYKDLNDDGVINAYDYSFIGYGRTPEIVFGLGVTLAYKGFDLALNFSGAGHTKMLLDSNGMWPFALAYPSYNIYHEYFDNRYIPGEDNTNAKYPVVHAGQSTNNFTVNSLYMHDASYLKLKTAEFGYNFSKKACSKIGAESVRIFLNGTNLFSLDKIKMTDPEFNHLGSATYPTQRGLTFSVQLGF
ncbi:MAG: TonB-dependent receptor, partial [Bacteroidales bacterium]|nr:TonB-dependent receptor [Candidatus Equibacterium intestinale]